MKIGALTISIINDQKLIYFNSPVTDSLVLEVDSLSTGFSG